MPTMRTNVFDDLFNTPFFTKSEGMMKTDIKETDKGYELVVDLPGFTKDLSLIHISEPTRRS